MAYQGFKKSITLRCKQCKKAWEISADWPIKERLNMYPELEVEDDFPQKNPKQEYIVICLTCKRKNKFNSIFNPNEICK